MPRISPAKEQPAADPARTVTVIYRPGREDPAETKWNGIVFKANVPVVLDRMNPLHSYEGLEREYVTNPLTGAQNTRHVACQLFMGDVAKGGYMWEVDGVQAKKKPPLLRGVPPPGEEWDREHEMEISRSSVEDESMSL